MYPFFHDLYIDPVWSDCGGKYIIVHGWNAFFSVSFDLTIHNDLLFIPIEIGVDLPYGHLCYARWAAKILSKILINASMDQSDRSTYSDCRFYNTQSTSDLKWHGMKIKHVYQIYTKKQNYRSMFFSIWVY